ncbi:hypothetical protein SAMN05421664_3288 [Chryseobacterium soldanellicola]|uniref:HEAT repeat-containing protein n=1 Tax=Chryseobacterium soldanellicola TaxID=311333 RepID=A0A1H1FVE9_9FLAO|nr:HEAT repeat domain-containing protein [Chryseobacterium soldanellicola]SDR04934.1 hypothetical protein SAMN05421664_3288 [Chryseobacterium soldanellicola]
MLSTPSIHFLFIVFLGILSLVVLFIVMVLFYSFLQYQKSLRASVWLKIINQKISETIVYDEKEVLSDADFYKFSKIPSFRNLFLQKLIDSEKKFSGTAKDKIKDLFRQYDLHHEAKKKLYQKKAYLIAGGIEELTVMDSKEDATKISTFLSHPSSQVYQEAQYAMVSLKGFEGLDFLNTAKHTISEWQQLRLLLSITSIPENSEEKIKDWLQSKNDSVIIFTLKLLRKFQLLYFYSATMDLMEHPSDEVRIQAVQTLLSLENPATIDSFIEKYPDQPVEVQSEILKAVKASKDRISTDLLKKELMDNSVPGIKVVAAEGLIALGHQEYLVQLAQDDSSSEELIQIIKHALLEKVW